MYMEIKEKNKHCFTSFFSFFLKGFLSLISRGFSFLVGILILFLFLLLLVFLGLFLSFILGLSSSRSSWIVDEISIILGFFSTSESSLLLLSLLSSLLLSLFSLSLLDWSDSCLFLLLLPLLLLLFFSLSEPVTSTSSSSISSSPSSDNRCFRFCLRITETNALYFLKLPWNNVKVSKGILYRNIFPLDIIGDSWNYMSPILVPSSAKRITTQMLVTGKLNGRKDFVLRGFVCDIIRPSKKLPVQS